MYVQSPKQTHRKEVVKKYRATGKPIIITAECNNFPACLRYPETDSPTAFVNSRAYIGTAKALRPMVSYAARKLGDIDDQQAAAQLYLGKKYGVSLDTHA